MANPKVIVTRPDRQAQILCNALCADGFTAVAFPMAEIVALEDRAEIEKVWRNLQRFSLVVFVSPNAVDAFLANNQEYGRKTLLRRRLVFQVPKRSGNT
jgi:uroporphyrinogen-III synthase